MLFCICDYFAQMVVLLYDIYFCYVFSQFSPLETRSSHVAQADLKLIKQLRKTLCSWLSCFYLPDVWYHTQFCFVFLKRKKKLAMENWHGHSHVGLLLCFHPEITKTKQKKNLSTQNCTHWKYWKIKARVPLKPYKKKKKNMRYYQDHWKTECPKGL